MPALAGIADLPADLGRLAVEYRQVQAHRALGVFGQNRQAPPPSLPYLLLGNGELLLEALEIEVELSVIGTESSDAEAARAAVTAGHA